MILSVVFYSCAMLDATIFAKEIVDLVIVGAGPQRLYVRYRGVVGISLPPTHHFLSPTYVVSTCFMDSFLA